MGLAIFARAKQDVDPYNKRIWASLARTFEGLFNGAYERRDGLAPRGLEEMLTHLCPETVWVTTEDQPVHADAAATVNRLCALFWLRFPVSGYLPSMHENLMSWYVEDEGAPRTPDFGGGPGSPGGGPGGPGWGV